MVDSSQAVVKSIEVVDAFQLVRGDNSSVDLPLHARAEAKWNRLRHRAKLLLDRTLRDPLFAPPSSHEIIAKEAEVCWALYISSPIDFNHFNFSFHLPTYLPSI